MVDYLKCLECETLMERVDSYPGALCFDCHAEACNKEDAREFELRIIAMQNFNRKLKVLKRK